jgi:N utilization substance protein A
MVVNELRGEKIDIVPFSEDLPDFIAKALSPARVNRVVLSDDFTQADVIVPDFQLSLAIGKEGQNARLAARLTGVRIDIKSEQMIADEAAGVGLADDDTEYEAGEWVTNPDTGVLEFHGADGTVVSQSEYEAGDGEVSAEPATTEPADAAATAEPAETAEPVADAEGAADEVEAAADGAEAPIADAGADDAG